MAAQVCQCAQRHSQPKFRELAQQFQRHAAGLVLGVFQDDLRQRDARQVLSRLGINYLYLGSISDQAAMSSKLTYRLPDVS